MILVIGGSLSREEMSAIKDTDPFWATRGTVKTPFNKVSDLIEQKDPAAYNARLLAETKRHVEDYLRQLTTPTPPQP